jgi:hypothetical protein
VVIAYLPPKPKTCDACGNGPCHDGTCCSGAHRSDWGDGWPIGSINIHSAIDYASFHANLVKICQPHPKDRHTPRSPRPGFRKR